MAVSPDIEVAVAAAVTHKAVQAAATLAEAIHHAQAQAHQALSVQTAAAHHLHAQAVAQALILVLQVHQAHQAVVAEEASADHAVAAVVAVTLEVEDKYKITNYKVQITCSEPKAVM